ncbi:MAG: PorV/PorQ family protein [Elusimicrobiota bacterium]
MRDKIKKTKIKKIEIKRLRFLNFLFSILYSLFSVVYASGTGTTTGTALLSAVGVRQMALGNSGTAVSGDVYSAFYNPALLSEISSDRAGQLSTFFTTGLSDDYKASIVYGVPLPSRPSGGKSSLAVGILHLNGGEMEINYVDGTSKNVVAQSDFLVFLGWGGYSSRNVSVGYNFKYLSTKLVEEYSSSAIAFDMGMQIKSYNDRFIFGIAGQNYGTSLKYRNMEESLPFLIRSGFSYRLFATGEPTRPRTTYHLLLAVIDGFYIMKEKNVYSSAGLEYSIHNRYFLRGGLKIMPTKLDRHNFTLGAGFRFYDRYSIDWATELSELNNPHNVAFTMRFGSEGNEIPQQQEVKKLKKQKEKPKKKVEEKINLAVADFVAKNVSQSDASIVADFVRTELVNIGVYKVIEKASMDKILAEASFQQTGCTEYECAVQIGKILNVKQMVVGSLSKLMDTYFITVNLVDVETGEILNSENIKAHSAEGLIESCNALAKKLTE